MTRRKTTTAPHQTVRLTIDGAPMEVKADATLLEACEQMGTAIPTLCYLETLTPVNVCRICVVEVERNRTLVPACSRIVEEGMVVNTDSERVRHSRKMVLEFLGSSVDLSLADAEVGGWMEEYDADPTRYGAPAEPTAAGERDGRHPGHHNSVSGETAEGVHQPTKVDNTLYVRDYSRCILCYKCVEACGIDAQGTYAIAVAGRGFDARISTEMDLPLGDGACVFCGNCIGVCPTGALMFRSEWELRKADLWDPEAQSVTRTVCSYCGVGCNLELHTQDNRIVKVTSPQDHEVTSGHLCIKGRFGYDYVQSLGDVDQSSIDEVLAAARRPTPE